jgi:hypothetical protein
MALYGELDTEEDMDLSQGMRRDKICKTLRRMCVFYILQGG